MVDKETIYTLHRYFIWANRMRDHFRQVVEAQGPPPESDALFHWLIGPFLYFCYWFATLYVIIEGWKELGLKDDKIDALLGSDYVDLLRRFRNGVFHFQRDYFDPRFTNYVKAGDPATNWADELHDEFSRYFLEWYESRGITYSLQELEDDKIRIVIEKNDNGQNQ